MLKTIYERSKDILSLSYLVNPVPEPFKKQKILVEFARDAALHIIATQQVEADADDRLRCACKPVGWFDFKGFCINCGGVKPPAA